MAGRDGLCDSLRVAKRQHGVTAAAFRRKWGLTNERNGAQSYQRAEEHQLQSTGDVMNRKAVMAVACVPLAGGFSVIAETIAVVISHLAGGSSAGRRLAARLERAARRARPRHAAAITEQRT